MSAPLSAAISALSSAFRANAAGALIDTKGYVSEAALNLVAGVRLEDFKHDLRQGSGNELEGKFRAAHSSSALAVNTFGPFKRAMPDLLVHGSRGFNSLQFERKCPNGLARATPPNLDVLLEGPGGVIAIESKCTEYLSPKAADFSLRYDEEIMDVRRQSGWFAHMAALRAAPDFYKTLDAAQLIKHAFGLMHTFPDRPVMLLYLFWEPANPHAHPVYARHRREIAAFAMAVTGAGPVFAAMSYPELWTAWETNAPSPWVSAHISNLRRRYAVEIVGG